MKLIAPALVLGLLAILSAGAIAQTADRPPAIAPPTDAKVVLPSIQVDQNRLETPAEGEARLESRRVALERQKIERVPPLPAQQISPGIRPAGPPASPPPPGHQ